VEEVLGVDLGKDRLFHQEEEVGEVSACQEPPLLIVKS
jgi:hypothetical protein